MFYIHCPTYKWILLYISLNNWLLSVPWGHILQKIFLHTHQSTIVLRIRCPMCLTFIVYNRNGVIVQSYNLCLKCLKTSCIFYHIYSYRHVFQIKCKVYEVKAYILLIFLIFIGHHILYCIEWVFDKYLVNQSVS